MCHVLWYLFSKVLGPQLDIHSGGQDLVFPHHENEEAQSCAFHGTSQWVNYWIHTGTILFVTIAQQI